MNNYGIKKLEKKGFVLFEDSQYLIFERREFGNELFDQIRIKVSTMAVKCSSYILSKEGYTEEPLILDEDILTSLLIVLKNMKKELKNE